MEIDFSSLPRKQLERIASVATVKVDDLYQKLVSLQTTLAQNAEVDQEVIEGWRSWMNTLDEDREAWAERATRLAYQVTEQRKKLGVDIACIKGLEAELEKIIDICQENSDEEKKTLHLRRALKAINEIADAAIADAHNEVLGWDSVPPEEVQAEQMGDNGV
jgi:DNA repair exonuclease SbcCD ATPase subunit